MTQDVMLERKIDISQGLKERKKEILIPLDKGNFMNCKIKAKLFHTKKIMQKKNGILKLKKTHTHTTKQEKGRELIKLRKKREKKEKKWSEKWIDN